MPRGVEDVLQVSRRGRGDNQGVEAGLKERFGVGVSVFDAMGLGLAAQGVFVGVEQGVQGESGRVADGGQVAVGGDDAAAHKSDAVGHRGGSGRGSGKRMYRNDIDQSPKRERGGD